MHLFFVGVFVTRFFVITFKLVEWSLTRDRAVSDQEEFLGNEFGDEPLDQNKGQLLIDALSTSFRYLLVRDPQGFFTTEDQFSYVTPGIRPFVFTDVIIQDCWDCVTD
jgi:hypothetical protein